MRQVACAGGGQEGSGRTCRAALLGREARLLLAAEQLALRPHPLRRPFAKEEGVLEPSRRPKAVKALPLVRRRAARCDEEWRRAASLNEAHKIFRHIRRSTSTARVRLLQQ